MSVQLFARSPQTLELVSFQPDHTPELARICYEAFSRFHCHHAVHQDIPDLDTGLMILSHIATRADYTGVVATLDGQIVGSNFLFHADEVAGIGPLTVDPQVQSQGIGRALMEWVIEEFQRRGIRQVRLFQEAINSTSLSLYTSLGFAWRDAAALMQATPAQTDHPWVRPLTVADLPSIKALSIQAYGFSRAHDAAQLLSADIPGFIIERHGKPTGYFVSSLFGHACAESDEDLLTLVGQAARYLPPSLAIFICPLSRTESFRQCLAARHHTLKVLSYMSYGDFTAPGGAYFPSIQC